MLKRHCIFLSVKINTIIIFHRLSLKKILTKYETELTYKLFSYDLRSQNTRDMTKISIAQDYK